MNRPGVLPTLMLAIVAIASSGEVTRARGAWQGRPRAVCTAADNRIKSSDPATGRLSNLTVTVAELCTGFLIDRMPADDPGERCVLSAGHCFYGQDLDIVEFEPLDPTTYNDIIGACVPTLSPPEGRFLIDKDPTAGHFIRRPNTLPTGGDYAVFRTKRNAVTGLSAFEQQGAAWRFASAFASPWPAHKYGYGKVGSPAGGEPGAPDTGPCTCRTGDPMLAQSYRQTQGFGTLQGSTANQLNYDIHTCGGDSGAPVIVEGLGVVAVHSGFRIQLDGVTDGCGVDPTTGQGVPFNAGTRIFDQMRADIARICPLDPLADTYLCYSAHDGTNPAQNPPDETLKDQFYEAHYDVQKVTRFCTPGERDGTPIVDAAVHLKRYKLKRLTQGKAPIVHVVVRNQLGDLTLSVQKEADLGMPTAKGLKNVPPVLEPGSPGYQPYKCHKVKKVYAAHPDVDVTVRDQFGTVQIRTGKPHRLCNPVTIFDASLDARAIVEPDRHLMCYKVEGDFERPPSVFANNDFGPEQLQLGKPKEICVPSAKIPVVCGDDFCDLSESPDPDSGCPADCD